MKHFPRPTDSALLPVITEFEEEKETVQTDATVCESDDLFSGLGGTRAQGIRDTYGIYADNIKRCAQICFCKRRASAGTDACGEMIIGTYLHGLFDNREFTEKLLQLVSGRKFNVPILRRIRNHSTISLQT